MKSFNKVSHVRFNAVQIFLIEFLHTDVLINRSECQPYLDLHTMTYLILSLWCMQ